MNNSWRFFKHPEPSTVILAGKMGFKRCGMDYQKEPALSMVYLLASLYVFLFINYQTSNNYLLQIKVVQASWVQDGIWPADLQAPESDNELLEELLSEPAVLQNSKEPKRHTETSKNAATLPCD